MSDNRIVIDSQGAKIVYIEMIFQGDHSNLSGVKPINISIRMDLIKPHWLSIVISVLVLKKIRLVRLSSMKMVLL